MAIEETVTRFVAAADWTDDCRVIVRVRRKSTLLSAAEARELAQELLQAAWNAEDAAAGAAHPVEASRFDAVSVKYCASQSGDNFLCTQPEGHEGVHVVRADPFSAPFAAWGGAA
ncbi:hypothetical protein [Microbacterium resistens]|uniref:hypothetical protein n=1 Tax=Microbacterium resistens TaxID=156977 RepID=UPI0036732EEE